MAGREPTGAPKPPAKGGSLTSSAAARETLTSHRPKAGLLCREARGALPFCSRHSLMPVGRRTGLSTSSARNCIEIAGNPHSPSTGVHNSTRCLWIERNAGTRTHGLLASAKEVMGSVKVLEETNTRARRQKTPLSGAFRERMMGLEPTTFCMASRRSSQLSYIRVGRQYSRGSGPLGTWAGRLRAGRGPRSRGGRRARCAPGGRRGTRPGRACGRGAPLRSRALAGLRS